MVVEATYCAAAVVALKRQSEAVERLLQSAESPGVAGQGVGEKEPRGQ